MVRNPVAAGNQESIPASLARGAATGVRAGAVLGVLSVVVLHILAATADFF